MSFAYLALYTGDYLRDTRHLSPMKHGIYLLLLMHCWDQKGPVPLDEQEAAGIANCRSQDEIEALRYVLARFFTRMDDGFYNHRMQKEIERAESISHARSDAGRKGYEARSKQLPSKSQAIAKQVHLPPPPPPSLSPPPASPSTPQGQKQNTSALTAPSDVDPQVWEDWKALRKAKKAAVTATAVAGIRKEAKAAGMTLEAALRLCCERGWAGFKAEWVAGTRPAAGSIEERNRAAAEAMKRMLDEQEKTIDG